MPIKSQPRPLPAIELEVRQAHPPASYASIEPVEPLLLATGARVLGRSAGPCRRCSRALLAGQRAADLAAGGVIHVSCATGTPS